jgi:hypothetical protein
MPFNLLILPLLGGYIFARKCYRTRYDALRSENYRLLFLAAEIGVYLLIIAAFLRFLFNWLTSIFPLLSAIDSFWHSVIPFEYSGTAFTAFLIGRTLYWIINKRLDRDEEVDKAIQEKGDALETLLQHAMAEARPILLTLKSGKVYVGDVLVNFNPAYELQSLKIMPILSGYRKTEDHQVVFNVDYFHLLEKIYNEDPSVSERDRMDLGTVVPMDEIRSVGIFSLPMYRQFFAHTSNKSTIQDHP